MNTSNALPAKLTAIAQQLARDFESVQTKYEIAFQTDAAENGPGRSVWRARARFSR